MSDVKQFKVLTNNILCKDAFLRNKKLYDFVNVVTDFGADNTANTDSSEAIQRALNSNNKYIYFPAGNYYVTKSLKIKSNTYLFGYRALIQSKDADNIFINDSDGTKGEYEANFNITIDGLQLKTLSEKATILAFGHCYNLWIRNCVFSSTAELQQWHLLEINSCQRVIIENCMFYGKKFTNEMLQFDVATGSVVFPWFGPYDSTPCQDIEVSNCFFKHDDKYDYETPVSTDVGIGNHNGSDTAPIRRVNIHNCHFSKIKQAFKFKYLVDSIISENEAFDCMSGFAFYSGNTIKGCQILNNHFKGNRSDYTEKTTSTTLCRGITFDNSNDLCYNNIVKGNLLEGFYTHGIACEGRYNIIENNTVRECGLHGIYADYNSYCCRWNNNMCVGNGKFSTDDTPYYDIYIGHFKASNVTLEGRNIISDNSCGTLGMTSFTGQTDRSYIFNNYYSTIKYPSVASLVNPFGNIQKDGTETINFTNPIDETNTISKTWNTLAELTADHTSTYIITFEVDQLSTYNGSFTIRLIRGNTELGRQTTYVSKNLNNSSGHLCCLTQIPKDGTVKAQVYFENTGVTGNAKVKAVELPIPMTTDSTF